MEAGGSTLGILALADDTLGGLNDNDNQPAIMIIMIMITSQANTLAEKKAILLQYCLFGQHASNFFLGNELLTQNSIHLQSSITYFYSQYKDTQDQSNRTNKVSLFIPVIPVKVNLFLNYNLARPKTINKQIFYLNLYTVF